MATANIDQDEEQYKKVEIEEVPDEEEVIATQNKDTIEPTDYILTDDEPKQPKASSKQPNISTTVDDPLKFDNAFSCYEKVLSQIASTSDDSLVPSNTLSRESTATATTPLPADDPIALRALKRFEASMNAATAASNNNKQETVLSASKGKSSWSGSLSASRKSLDNLFKNLEQQIRTTQIPFNEQSISAATTPLADGYIRPRRTFDDHNFNYGTTLDSLGTTHSIADNTQNDDYNIGVQQQSSIKIENDDKRVVDNESTNIIELKDQQEIKEEAKEDVKDEVKNELSDKVKQEFIEEVKEEIKNDTTATSESVLIHQSASINDASMISDATITNESEFSNENENINVPTNSSSTDDSVFNISTNVIVSKPLVSTTDEPSIRPYGFQIEGRRPLNTIERLRERRQSRESLDTMDQQPQPQQLQQKVSTEYTVKPEQIQDPIVRRALERFDEKSRKLTQTKSMNYDEIQDPITRRALMRLESNLKRVIPSTTNDVNENWYTENYTLGSLQPANDRLSRHDTSSQSPTSNNKTKYVSVHQRYCTPTSNDILDLSTTNNLISSNGTDIPPMRVPAQSIFVTSNNEQLPQPISFRQRSRSEDMLTSRDLTIGPTANFDDIEDSAELQRNHSSNAVATNNSDLRLPATLIKTLEPNFTRTTESTVSYVTPTQTYSAYSCEYTRPRRNNLLTSSISSTPSETSSASKNDNAQLSSPHQQQEQQQHEIQRPIPYRPTIENRYEIQSSSAFAPVHSSTLPQSNYNSQSPLPATSYGSLYSSNNSTQSSYAEDPIVRRALERFNSHVQNSLLTKSQYQPTNSYYSQQNGFQDPWMNSNRSSLMTASMTSTGSSGGYQSIIGRRRQTRLDDVSTYIDTPSVGDAYSSSIFGNMQNSQPITNNYMNIMEQAPVIPPRARRLNQNEDMNHQHRRRSINEYSVDNSNNNNNNSTSQTLPRNSFIHYAYPATITTTNDLQASDIDDNQQFDSNHSMSQEQIDIRHRTQSTSSTNSTDSMKPQKPPRPTNIRAHMNSQRRGPPLSMSLQANMQQNERRINDKVVPNKLSPTNSQSSTGHIQSNNGNDSVFHRLAYTGTKASLSKTSSNSCSNLLNKNSLQTPVNQLKTCEIDLDDSLTTSMIESHTDSISEQNSIASNKYNRSRSVDGRTRLKFIQARTTQSNQTATDTDETNSLINDEQDRSISSSRFVPVSARRETSATHIPLTPPSIHQTTSSKLPPSRNNLTYMKSANEIRTQDFNGNHFNVYNQQQELENNENMSYNIDNHKAKSTDNRTRTSIPFQHFTANNNIQPSSSTSSVNSVVSRAKPPISIPISIDRRDSNSSSTDLNRTPRRSDDNRLVSPGSQRRHIPVSVFSPAKPENKRPAPAPPLSNSELQHQSSISSRSVSSESSSTNRPNELQIHKKASSTNSGVKTPTKNVTNEFSLAADKHDNNKKMNVFERLFRGNKKKA